MFSSNVSTTRDAETAFSNSGWLDRFENDETERAGAFIRKNSSADHIDEDEFNALMARFAVEVVGWKPEDL